jgi:hypothetical protein
VIIDYLREENRVLRPQLGGRRPKFSHDQRRRLAAKAQGLGRKILADVGTVDGNGNRAPGQPRTAGEIEALVVRMAKKN